MQNNNIENINKNQIDFHLYIALVCIPIYIFSLGGEPMKYILAPYILYMVLSVNANFFPALLLHFMMGTTISFVILVGCIILVFQNWKLLIYKYKLGVHLFFLLFVFLILNISTIQRISNENVPFLKILDSYAICLAFFAFFYGILIYNNITKLHLMYVFFCVTISIYIQLFTQNVNIVGYLFYVTPQIFSLILVLFFTKNLKISNFLFIISIINIPLLNWSLGGISFTIALTTIFAMFFVYVYFKNLDKIKKYLPIFILVLVSYMVIYSISSYLNFTSQINPEDYENLSFDLLDFESNKNKFLFKLFDDRAPIWKGVFEEFVLNGSIFPSFSSTDYSITTIEGAIQNCEIAAHNVPLEIIRNYGILCGVILSVIYIHIAILSSRILKIKNLDIMTLSIGACIVPIALVGGATGQYPLMANFSFMFLGLMGFCYGKYFNTKVN